MIYAISLISNEMQTLVKMWPLNTFSFEVEHVSYADSVAKYLIRLLSEESIKLYATTGIGYH